MSALMGLSVTILQNYSNKNRHHLVIQAKKKKKSVYYSSIRVAVIVLTAGGRSASTLNSHNDLLLCMAFQLLSQSETWSTLETLGIRNAVSITADGAVLSQARLSAGQVNITQNSMKNVPHMEPDREIKGPFLGTPVARLFLFNTDL